jgi:hypothetical protein
MQVIRCLILRQIRQIPDTVRTTTKVVIDKIYYRSILIVVRWAVAKITLSPKSAENC